MGSVTKAFWRDIQNRYLQCPEVFIQHPELRWITKIDFEKLEKNPVRRILTIVNQTKRITSKVISKFGI